MYCNEISDKPSCKFSVLYTAVIACVWIIGLLLGCYLVSHSTVTDALINLNFILFPASFFHLLFVLFLPFLISAFLIRFSLPLLSLSVVFAKAIMVGCCSCTILAHFSTAGWLIRSLLLFSDSLIIILLVWFWVRNIAGDRSKLYTDTILCTVLTFIISCIDYFAVSPFLVTLFNM